MLCEVLCSPRSGRLTHNFLKWKKKSLNVKDVVNPFGGGCLFIGMQRPLLKVRASYLDCDSELNAPKAAFLHSNSVLGIPPAASASESLGLLIITLHVIFRQ